MDGIYPTQIIVKTASRETGQYGPKLKLTDVNGKPFSISEKHKDLWPIFENNTGKTITLTWNIPPAGVTWKAFISKAEVAATQPAQTAPPASTPPVRPQQAVKPLVTPPVAEQTYNGLTKAEWAAKEKATRESIEVQNTFTGTVALINAGKLPVDGENSRLFMLAQAWAVQCFDAALDPKTVELIETRIKSLKEAAKPKKVEGK